MRALASEDFEAALAVANGLPPAEDETPWTADALRRALDGYYAEHQRICLDPAARNLRHTYVTVADDKLTWRVQQMIVDPEEHNDWVAEFRVSLADSRTAREPVLRLVRLGSLV